MLKITCIQHTQPK